MFWISNSRAVVPEASRARRRLTVSESELKTPTLDRIGKDAVATPNVS